MPSVRAFQIDPGGLGGLTESVNLFRGQVTMPLQLASVTARSGLEASATLIYQGPSPDEVDTRNLDAPTGPVGIGWSMGFEFIALDDRGTGAPGGDDYYLIADGRSRRLFRMAATEEYEEFELEEYEFWRIRHHPADERWVIVRENGDRYVYGGRVPDLTTSPVQYGLKWGGTSGNWRGSSTQTSGQTRFPVAWNLAEIRNPWGDLIRFEYDNDLEVVGTSAGLTYTRSSRLVSVASPFGRTMAFEYGHKVHDISIREYQIPHVDPDSPELHAFQDRYDTRYLKSIEVTNSPDAASGAGESVLAVHFEYTLLNIAENHQGSPDYYKRYLTRIVMATGDGLALPGYDFEYYDDPPPDDDAGRRGTLKTIVHPQGGTATYAYEQMSLTGTDRSLTITPTGVPRVWFGPDYTVITVLDGARRGLEVLIYYWTGEWVTACKTYSIPENIDITTLRVSAEQEFFALSFVSRGSNPRLHMGLFHKRYGRRGDWFMDSDLAVLNIDNGDQGIVVTGAQFAVAVASGGHMRVRVWDPVAKAWSDRRSQPLDRNGSYALAATRDYYALASFQVGSRRVNLDMWYLDRTDLQFQPIRLQVSTLNNVDWDESSTPKSFWSTGTDYAVMTYPTSRSGKELDYKIVIQQWDRDFRAQVKLDRSFHATADADLPYLRSVASGAVVGNADHLFRFNGVRWVEGRLPLPAKGEHPYFAYGSDAAVVSGADGAALAAYDPFTDQWSVVRRTTTGGSGVRPTISGDFVSMNRTVLYRNPSGEFVEVSTLSSAMLPRSLENRAPRFLVYQDTARSTVVVPVANGQVISAAATRLPDEQIVVDGEAQPGKDLVGPDSFVTFRGASFDRPAELTLHRYLDEQVTGPVVRHPVVALRLDTGVAPHSGDARLAETGVRYAYDCDNVGVSPDGSTAEFAAATAIYGMESTEPVSTRFPAPVPTPFGRSEFRFYTDRSPRSMGLVPDDAVLGSAGFYYSYLNGMLYDQTDYDADGEPVERVMNLYEVVTTVDQLVGGRARPLVGGYVRPVAVETSQYEKVIEVPARVDGTLESVPTALAEAFHARNIDVEHARLVAAPTVGRWWLFPDPDRLTYLPVSYDGELLTASVAVTRTVHYAHSRITGLLVSDWTSAHDARGRVATSRREIYYGWQVPQYAVLGEAHIWSLVVLSIRFHQVDDSAPGHPVEFALTTVKTWPGEDADDVTIAPCRTYTALSADVHDTSRTVPVAFDDWDNSRSEPPGWRRMGEVVSRTVHGAVLEATDVQGNPSCNVLNSTGTQRLAEFTNAGLDEVSYLGFEQYESDNGWSLADGSDLRENIVEGDAHTGFRSLGLPVGSPPLRRSFTLRTETVYILTYWLKTPVGFSGDAAWRIEGPGGVIATFRITGTGDEWAYRHHVVRLGSASGDTTDVTVTATNAGASGQLLLDDILFSPLRATAKAAVFHPRFGDPIATVSSDGATTRSINDSYRRAVGSTGPNGAVTSTLALDLVRHRAPEPAGVLPADEPNSIVNLRPQGGGVLADLTQGESWAREWSEADPARWSTRDGLLVHIAADDDVITFRPSKGLDDYGVRVSVHLPRAQDGTRTQPGKPLGLAIGDDLRAVWKPDGGWSVTVAGEAISLGKGRPGAGVATDWMLLAPKDPVTGRTSVFFYADGEQLFARLEAPPIAGPVSLMAGDLGLGFSDIATLVGPEIAVTYLDGAAREIQQQAFDGTGTVVAATVHDRIGRAAIGTKAAKVLGGPAYRAEFVRTFDPATGVMTGQVSDEHPADEGYPYVRTEFRRTAQSLASAQGVPGREFAIRGDADSGENNVHVRRMDNGTNTGGEFGQDPWPPNQYFVTRVTDPNGDRSYSIFTKTGEKVGVARGPAGDERLEVAWFDYDEAGRITRVLPPAGVRARQRGEEDWERWATVDEYNYAGELVRRTTPDSGTAQYVHDRAGAVRFVLTAEGGAPGDAGNIIVYFKYDGLGRKVEHGFFSATWDPAFLREKACTSPDWPDGTQAHTVTLRNTYDGDGSTPTHFGRLVSTETWQVDGAVSTTERFSYDIAGNTVVKALSAYGFDDNEHVVSYCYDNMSNLTGIEYPEGSSIPRIVNTYDRLGRLCRVGTPDDAGAFGSFSYGPQGEVTEASKPLDATRTLRSVSSYNPPGWPLGTRHELDDGSLVLDERLTYTEDAQQDAAYFDGKVASSTIRDGVDSQTYHYRYDGLSRITAARDPRNPDAGLDAAYDANGNFSVLTRDAREETYSYRPRSNQAETVTADGQQIDRYSYNRDGAVTGGERLGIERITYDPVTRLPRTITLGAVPPGRASAEKVEFDYDGTRQRIVKLHTNTAGAAISARLYVRGIDTSSLYERVRTTTAAKNVQYVYGPDGLMMLLAGPKRYTVVRDHLGSPRRVVDEVGAVVAAYDYTTFGATITRAGATEPDVLIYRYTGQEWDAETGLYNYRARFYDPVLGRFYDVDPAAQGSSPYVYVENNPSNMIDPDGEEPLTAFLIIVVVSAVLGAVAGAVTYAVTHEGNFNVGTFFAYAAVGAVAGAAGGAIGYGAGLLATAGLVAAGVSTSTSVASGVVVGAVTGTVDGVIAGSLNQVGVNLVEGRPIGDGVGLAAGMGAGIGAVAGGLLGGATGFWNKATATRLMGRNPAQRALLSGDRVITSPSMMTTSRGGTINFPKGIRGVVQGSRENFRAALSNFDDADSVLTIFGHGSRSDRILRLNDFDIGVDKVIDSLKGNRMYGINMLSCYAGSNGVARTLANRLNVPVRASNVIVTISSLDAGTPYLTWRQVLQGGAFRTYYPSRLKTGWIALFGY